MSSIDGNKGLYVPKHDEYTIHQRRPGPGLLATMLLSLAMWGFIVLGFWGFALKLGLIG